VPGHEGEQGEGFPAPLESRCPADHEGDGPKRAKLREGAGRK